MPSREILQRRIRRNAGRLRGEVDPNERSDIRDSEAIARDERLVADLRVEPLQLLLDGLALRLAVFGELLDARLEQLVGVLERTCGNGKEVQLHSPVPHLDERLLAVVLAHQVRLGMQTFEVATDRDRLGEMGAIVELDERQAACRILREHLRRAVLAGENVDFLSRDLESLLRYENSEASRVGSERGIIN